MKAFLTLLLLGGLTTSLVAQVRTGAGYPKTQAARDSTQDAGILANKIALNSKAAQADLAQTNTNLTILAGNLATTNGNVTTNANDIAGLKTSKADAATSYTQVQVNNLLKGYYLPTQAATKAAAVAIATGSQPRIIRVAVDESDGNRTTNVYLYHGDGAALGPPLF